MRHYGLLAAVVLPTLACGKAPDTSGTDQDLSALATITLSATPARIQPGGTAKLVPHFASGTGSIAPGIGRVTSDVAVTVDPAATTTYTLSVTARGRTATRAATVTVAAAVAPGVVYDDALENGWQDWSWVTHDLSNASPVSGGSRSISVSYGPWTGISFDVPAGVPAAGAGTVEFDIHPGDTSDPAINAIVQVNGVWGPEVRITPYCGNASIPADVFTHCAVPLTALQAANVTFQRIALKEALGLTLSTIYVDQISIVPQASTPAPPAIQSFTATPSSVVAGNGAVLSAAYSGGTGTIDNGVGPIASGGSITVKPAATTTYTLTVSDSAGNTAKQPVTVTVTPAPAIQSFTATPSSIAAGDTAVLSATFSGGAGTIDNGVGAIASGGTVTVQPAATTTYTLTVSDGAGHGATQSITVSVTPPPAPAIQSFTATPASVVAGDAAVLAATYSGGTGAIDNGVGAIASGGTVTVRPPVTTTYTLTITDGAGHTATQAVTVAVTPAPAIQGFTATPSSVVGGDSAVLSATYSNGTGTIDNGVGAIASGGTATVKPSATTTYTLTVSDGAGHSATKSVTITVTPPPAIQTFSANPASIVAGGSTVLSATYSGGSGTIDNGVGAIASGGTVTATPGATTTYTLTVSDGLGHSATRSVTVTVTPPPAIQSFSATPPSIVGGDSAVLSATYSNGTGTIDNGVGPIASGGTATVKPSATTTYTLTVSDGAGHSATKSVTITVTPPPAIQSFSANPASIAAGGSTVLSATYSGGTGTIDNGVGAIASGGTVNATPGTTTTYTLTVSDGSGHAATMSTTVTVTVPSSNISVSVTPQASETMPGGVIAFTAAVTGAASGQSTAATWSLLEGSAGGSIDASGRYTAPSAEGTYHVVATSVADPSKSAAVPVGVTALSFLPPDRRTVWNPGLLSQGGIPNRTTVCATVQASTYGNGAQDATSAINSAITACPDGQVVQLSAGTFTINNDIIYVNKGVTLRGAGATQTVLQRTNGATQGSYIPGVAKPVVIVGTVRWSTGGTGYNLAADAAKGTYSVKLASAPAGGLAVGQIVEIDELSGAAWQTDPGGRGQIWASPDFRVVYQRHNPSLGTDDPWPDAASWFSRFDRVTSEIKEVKSWDPATLTVTFTSPMHIDYRASHTAQLYTFNDKFVKNAGVEDLKLQGGDDGQLRFVFAAYSWAARVENTGWLGEGFSMNNSFRVEVRDSWVHTPVWMEPGGASYNISLSGGSSEVLLENNISTDADKVMVARCSGAGSVVAYNYMDDGHIGSNPTWVEIGLNASHMVGPHHVLFEGNYGFNWDSDKTHGNSIYHTIFRNHLSGKRRDYTDGAPVRCAGATFYSYWHSFVGNVLGLPNQMSGFVYQNGTLSGNAVWKLGWDDWSPYPTDPQVAATTYRHGNFDYLTNSVAWDATNANHALPPSLYLSQKPAFFNAGHGYAWPWVDPTASTPLQTLPAKARYDAGTPFVQP